MTSLESRLLVRVYPTTQRYLGLLYVVERFRGSGLARQMITTARDVERSANFSGVVCLTSYATPQREAMFAKLNYETTATLMLYRGVIPTDINRDCCDTDIRQVGLTRPTGQLNSAFPMPERFGTVYSHRRQRRRGCKGRDPPPQYLTCRGRPVLTTPSNILTSVLFFPFSGTSEYRKSLSFSSAMRPVYSF